MLDFVRLVREEIDNFTRQDKSRRESASAAINAVRVAATRTRSYLRHVQRGNPPPGSDTLDSLCLEWTKARGEISKAELDASLERRCELRVIGLMAVQAHTPEWALQFERELDETIAACDEVEKVSRRTESSWPRVLRWAFVGIIPVALAIALWLQFPHIRVEGVYLPEQPVPGSIAASITLENVGFRQIVGDYRHYWFLDGGEVQNVAHRLTLARGDQQLRSANLLIEDCAEHEIRYQLEKDGTILGTRVATLSWLGAHDACTGGAVTSSVPPADSSIGFVGRWYVQFHFERNTGKPDERPHPWIAFDTNFNTDGQNNYWGNLESGYTVGSFNGTGSNDSLRGGIKLGWDSVSWQKFELTKSSSSSAEGEAIFLDPTNGEQHYYRLVASRL
jgi:hypothetical protein